MVEYHKSSAPRSLLPVRWEINVDLTPIIKWEGGADAIVLLLEKRCRRVPASLRSNALTPTALLLAGLMQ